jgi:hypothetical protein
MMNITHTTHIYIYTIIYTRIENRLHTRAFSSFSFHTPWFSFPRKKPGRFFLHSEAGDCNRYSITELSLLTN